MRIDRTHCPVRPVPSFPKGAAGRAVVMIAWAAWCATVNAQAPATNASRIDKVTLYQGSATVERTVSLAAGAREAAFLCLPASLDPKSLQVQSDAGVRLGEVRVDTTERALMPECAGPHEARIRSLEDDLARVNAAASALQLADSYLKTIATSRPGDGKAGTTPTAVQIDATALALRRGAEDNQVRAHQLQRDKEALELRLKALQLEQNRTAARQSRVVSVHVQLATDRAAVLRLAYQVPGPNWQSSYRATLDTDKGSVRIERQALVAQASGEDWAGVQLRLSTGAPQRSTQGQLPRPWLLDLAPTTPLAARSGAVVMEKSVAPAAAPMAAADASGEALPDFEVQAQDGAYATDFIVPGRIHVPSSGERIALSLGSTDAATRLLTRTAPAVEQAAYLVAEIERPTGVWPAGPVALVQGTRFVGNGRLDFSSDKTAHAASYAPNQAARDAVNTAVKAELSFGRDDKVVVRADAPQEQRGTAGLTGSRTERTVQSRYRVDNLHTGAMELQVLHAAPVSRDDKIEVQSRYTPAPASLAFAGSAGTVVWQQALAAGASATFAAEHVLTYPKDAPLRERR